MEVPLYALRSEPYSLRRGGNLSDINARRICFNKTQISRFREELVQIDGEFNDLVRQFGYTATVADRLGEISRRKIRLGNLIDDFTHATRSIRAFELRRLQEIYTRILSNPTDLENYLNG